MERNREGRQKNTKQPPSSMPKRRLRCRDSCSWLVQTCHHVVALLQTGLLPEGPCEVEWYQLSAKHSMPAASPCNP